MKKYLLSPNGTFYKANLHCHSTITDGCMSPEEIKMHYKENGYSIVAFTDHDILIPHPELADDEFLPLNGYEVEVTESGPKDINYKKSCHICYIALDPDNLKQVCYHRSKYLVGNGVNYVDQIQFDESLPDYEREHTPEKICDMMELGRNNGFFVTLNHLTWSLETYVDYMSFNHMHAMEIYNHSSFLSGNYEHNEKEYDALLRGGKRIFCTAGDDTHSKIDSCGGFIMIKSEKLEYRAITNALINGYFYASHGPLIYNLWFEDGKVHIDCSDAASIRLNTASRRANRITAEEGKFINSAEFDVNSNDGYIRITVTDARGNHANTNAYFIDELLK